MSHLPLNINYVSEEILLKAERELKETPMIRKEALEQFRKAIQDEPSLSCLTDDSFLLMFLRSRKFNVKQAMDTLKNFYILKSKNKDIVRDFSLEIAEKLIKKKVITVLPYRDHDGCPILIVAFDNFDFEETDFSDFLTTLMIIELILTDISATSQICGLKFIEDAKVLRIRHLKYITLRHLILCGKAMIGAVPIRYKSVHITNASSVIDWTWSIVKFALSEKLRDRYHFQRTSDLKTYFDSSLLPEEFGGTLKFDNEFLIKLLRKKTDRILQISNGSWNPAKQ